MTLARREPPPARRKNAEVEKMALSEFNPFIFLGVPFELGFA